MSSLLKPARVVARFIGGATKQDVVDGSAVLAIVHGDDSDRDEQAYWVRALYEGDRCVAFVVTKFGTGDRYRLPRSLATCSCPDGTHRPGRPGGCRHAAALRQALPTVSR
jgi:hypothetical protein